MHGFGDVSGVGIAIQQLEVTVAIAAMRSRLSSLAESKLKNGLGACIGGRQLTFVSHAYLKQARTLRSPPTAHNASEPVALRKSRQVAR